MLKQIHLTQHAFERMSERGITREYIRQALESPIEVTPSGPGKKKYKSALRNKKLMVVAHEGEKEFFVVTAYWED